MEQDGSDPKRPLRQPCNAREPGLDPLEPRCGHQLYG